jgi:hypothetical protein
MIHGIALLWLRETDSAHFPSDVNPLVVIFLLDYLILSFPWQDVMERSTETTPSQRPSFSCVTWSRQFSSA